jgi:hypothetical protein
MPDRLAPNHIRAGDLEEQHIGRLVSAEGVTGVLRAYYHHDNSHTQLLLGSTILDLPAGRPIALPPA